MLRLIVLASVVGAGGMAVGSKYPETTSKVRDIVVQQIGQSDLDWERLLGIYAGVLASFAAAVRYGIPAVARLGERMVIGGLTKALFRTHEDQGIATAGRFTNPILHYNTYTSPLVTTGRTWEADPNEARVTNAKSFIAWLQRDLTGRLNLAANFRDEKQFGRHLNVAKREARILLTAARMAVTKRWTKIPNEVRGDQILALVKTLEGVVADLDVLTLAKWTETANA